MGMRIFLFAAFLAAFAPPATAFGQAYGLRSLRPVGLSSQVTGNDRKQLLHFRNDLGEQYLLYEESASAGGVREVAGLATYMSSTDHVCSIDLECKTKAFCTGDCKKFYYEVFNTSVSGGRAGRNECTIKAFSCNVPGSGP
jgi:hypothetical protein